MKIVKEMPESGKFLCVYMDWLDGYLQAHQWRWNGIVLEEWDTQCEEFCKVSLSQYPDNLYYIVADAEWDEDEERALFEKTYQIPPEVKFRKGLYSSGRGGYAVRIIPSTGLPFWASVNAAHQVQCNWEVWLRCALKHSEVTK